MRYSLIILSFIILSCTSPLDVEVNDRKEDEIYIPDPNAPKIKVDKDVVDFGFVDPSSLTKNTITIRNLTFEEYEISDVFFAMRPSYFFVDNELEFPIVLGKSGEDNDEVTLNINCYQTETGQFNDFINVVGDSVLSLPVVSKVADLFINDIDFNDCKVNTKADAYVTAINHGYKQVTIDDIYFEGPDKDFFKLNITAKGIYILGTSFNNSTYRFPITFSPTEKREYNARLVFKNDSDGLVKEFSILTGVGI